jgi:hypothetical protein
MSGLARLLSSPRGRYLKRDHDSVVKNVLSEVANGQPTYLDHGGVKAVGN